MDARFAIHTLTAKRPVCYDQGTWAPTRAAGHGHVCWGPPRAGGAAA